MLATTSKFIILSPVSQHFHASVSGPCRVGLQIKAVEHSHTMQNHDGMTRVHYLWRSLPGQTSVACRAQWYQESRGLGSQEPVSQGPCKKLQRLRAHLNILWYGGKELVVTGRTWGCTQSTTVDCVTGARPNKVGTCCLQAVFIYQLFTQLDIKGC